MYTGLFFNLKQGLVGTGGVGVFLIPSLLAWGLGLVGPETLGAKEKSTECVFIFCLFLAFVC